MARTAPMSTMELESRETGMNGSPKQEERVSISKEEPPQEAIAQLAYSYWLERQNGNGHEGSPEEDWLRAERELRGRTTARS
jgi:hypothetical protein